MIYDVSHSTTFHYAWGVSVSQHLVHLAPRATRNQDVLEHRLRVTPSATISQDDRDYFGNATTYLTIEEPHERMTITSRSRVRVTNHDYAPPEQSPAWEDVARTVLSGSVPEALDVLQYVFQSPFTFSETAEAYARPSFPASRPIIEGAIDLMARIFTDFVYEGGVTEISTPVDDVLEQRRGVCQDFAHLQIACLRALDLPARYVSGYLRTHPPEGEPRRIGADASHAWLSVWAPDRGWVDLDPTNNILPGDEHITVAWGRDYGDVSPINGMVIGGGEQKIDVAVDVRPVE